MGTSLQKTFENNFLWELTTKHKRVNLVKEVNLKNGIDEVILKHCRGAKKYSCIFDKAGRDYKHDDLKKRAWISIGEKLEIEGKATKVIWVYLKKVLSKGRIKTWEVDLPGVESALLQKSWKPAKDLIFQGSLFPFVSSELQKQNWYH